MEDPNIQNTNIILMTEYCLEKQIRFELNFAPENYSYRGSNLEKEFQIILQGGKKGTMKNKVFSVEEIEEAVNFYQGVNAKKD